LPVFRHVNIILYLTQGQKILDAFNKLTRLKPDRRVMVFLFFLVVSSIFWFLNALSREYTTSIMYPVRYTNYPENMVLIGEPPRALDLTVNAYGYTLLKYYITRRLLPIVFDVNYFSLNRLPDTGTRNFYILSSLATNRVAGQLGADIEILDIRPDTLYFKFSDMVSARLPVKPVLELEFDQQFMVKGEILVEPDSITVSGPASHLDTMQFIPTKKLILKGLKESAGRKVELAEIDLINYSISGVTVTIPVEQFTEASIRVPVETVNLPDTLSMKTFPSEVTVSYLVSLTDYEKVNAQLFKAVVDYATPVPANGRLPVLLLSTPDFIRSVRYSPGSVDFIIER